MQSHRSVPLLSLCRSPLLTVPCRNVRGSTLPQSEYAKEMTKPDSPFALKPRNEPAYIRYTAEQKDWFWRGMLRRQGTFVPVDMPRDKYPLPELLKKPQEKQVDPDAEPFRQIYEGNEDGGNFSGAEVVKDENVWFWVQRILPNNNPPDLPRTDCRDRMPSGWIPPPITPPDRPYFVRRLWNGLYPVSKHLVAVKEKMYLKRVDDHIMDMHPDVLTLLELVDGDVRTLELELMEHIQRLKKRRVLSAVSEIDGKITFKGNHVEEIVHWLEDNGF